MKTIKLAVIFLAIAAGASANQEKGALGQLKELSGDFQIAPVPDVAGVAAPEKAGAAAALLGRRRALTNALERLERLLKSEGARVSEPARRELYGRMWGYTAELMQVEEALAVEEDRILARARGLRGLLEQLKIGLAPADSDRLEVWRVRQCTLLGFDSLRAAYANALLELAAVEPANAWLGAEAAWLETVRFQMFEQTQPLVPDAYRRALKKLLEARRS